MNKLLEHFKRMQDMAARYILPNEVPYVNRDGKASTTTDVAGANDPHGNIRRKLFENDMIYMLDGPEQREAEQDMSELLDQLADAQNLRNRIAVLESDLTRANARCKPLEDENNDLRSRLMNMELEHAKLRGYLERIEDERPPQMVPLQTKRFLARGNDASGYAFAGASMRKPWFHR